MPWGSVAALLASCFVTIVGVVRGIDPEVILGRAIVAAVVLGSLTSVASAVASKILQQPSGK